MYNSPSDKDLDLTIARVRAALYPFRMRKLEPDIRLITNGLRYGNTQALIIRSSSDNSHNTAYKIVTSNDAPLDQASQQQEDALTQHLETNQYRRDKPASCQPAQLALSSYRGFKVLFGERLHAHNYPAIQNTDQVFMKLPGELRNRIYKLFLVMDPEIDLNPYNYMPRRSAVDCAVARSVNLKPILRMLRLNRQINREASDILYSDNDSASRMMRAGPTFSPSSARLDLKTSHVYVA